MPRAPRNKVSVCNCLMALLTYEADKENLEKGEAGAARWASSLALN